MQQAATLEPKLVVDGTPYFSAQDVAQSVGVSRQTLWRWRSAEKIPAGHRFRNNKVLFSDADLACIQAFALHFEPATPGSRSESRGGKNT